MKAIVYHNYGLPDVLELEDVKKPVPSDNEVLVKVHAVSVNSWDWDLLQGKPFVNRLIAGLLKPKKITILGCDIAGKIEAVGNKVKRFKPSDEVFGDLSGGHWGGFAQYVCAHEKDLALKPASMPFEQAAAIPQAAVLALQGLRKGRIMSGQNNPVQRVLINGAGGGVGSFAIQIAKSFGAEVTGVDSMEKLDSMRSLGADHVIDYTQEDFTTNGLRYDLILDVWGYHSIFDYNRALSPKGIYVMVGGSTTLLFQILFLGSLFSMSSSKKMSILMHKPDPNDLDFIKTLFEAGKVIPVIDKSYPLREAPEALRYLGEGKAKGKVVIILE